MLVNLITNWLAYILVGLLTLFVFCNLRINLEFWSWIRYLLLAFAATVHTISLTTEYVNGAYQQKWWKFYVNYFVQVVFFAFYLRSVSSIITCWVATNKNLTKRTPLRKKRTLSGRTYSTNSSVQIAFDKDSEVLRHEGLLRSESLRTDNTEDKIDKMTNFYLKKKRRSTISLYFFGALLLLLTINN